MKIDEFYRKAASIIVEFNDFIARNKLEKISQIDHICYKCGSSERFELIRKNLENESHFVYQSIISKRRIAYIKLKRDFETELGEISYLELSDQKPDSSQNEGFDHIEIIPKDISYDELVSNIVKNGENARKIERPHHTTYDVEIPGGFSIKVSREMLIEKIKREEML